mmetsp:Transcript_14288/g.35506  ORF Transcript_14288/g.35506 Transcript_14288/m.35506 type:complete len:116 (-) Transcript_14288:81-428(-)
MFRSNWRSWPVAEQDTGRDGKNPGRSAYGTSGCLNDVASFRQALGVGRRREEAEEGKFAIECISQPAEAPSKPCRCCAALYVRDEVEEEEKPDVNIPASKSPATSGATDSTPMMS